MGKSNVNPDHYKVAGRERPGEHVTATEEKRDLRQADARRQNRETRKAPQKKK